VDAIRFGELHNGNPQVDRPDRSAYHVNYRQASGHRYLPGGRISRIPNVGYKLEGVDTPQGPSINVNVTNTTWGAALHHLDLDTHGNVMKRILNGFDLPPGPGESNHDGIVDKVVP
jgi:hypothetical protein